MTKFKVPKMKVLLQSTNMSILKMKMGKSLQGGGMVFGNDK